MVLSSFKKRSFKSNGTKIRTRCRVCGRCRYIRFLRPSVTHPGKWMCQDQDECMIALRKKLIIK